MERPSRRRSADEAFACTAPNSHKQEFSIDHHQNVNDLNLPLGKTSANDIIEMQTH